MVSNTSLLPRLAATLAVCLVGLAQAAPAPVPTLLVGMGSAGAGLELEGTLQALQQSTVAAQTGGNVLQLAVKAGDRVKAGALLARIDDRELQAGLAAATPAWRRPPRRWRRRSRTPPHPRVCAPRASSARPRWTWPRRSCEAAQAAHRQAQASRTQAALARSFAAVTAPFDAIVLATQVEAGDLAAPGRAIVTLYAPGRLRAVVQVPLSRAAWHVRPPPPRSRCSCPTAAAWHPHAHRTARHRRGVADRGMALTCRRRHRRSGAGQPVQVRFAGAASAGPRCHPPPGGAARRRAAARRADGRLCRAGRALRAQGRAPGQPARATGWRCWPA
jgi:biotin carboxyl carrier protein